MGTVVCLLTSCMDEPTLTKSEQNALSKARTTANPSNIRLHKNQFIVLSTNEQLPADLASNIKGIGGNVLTRLDQVGILVVSSNTADFRAKAEKVAGVRSVIPDFSAQWNHPENMDVELLEDAVGNPPSSGDDDPRFDLQWGHDAINAPEAWNAGYRGAGAVVAVLDGGFDLDNGDLAPNIIDAKSFVPGQPAQFNAPAAAFSHGSHVAGTIAGADNGRGIIGVAPSAKLMLLKVLRDSGSGSFSWMMNAIVYATVNGADVINMSLGAAIPRNGKFLDEDGNVVNDTKAVQELLVAISRVTNFAKKNNVTVIASAGNDANDGNHDGDLVHIPSQSGGVISISATAPVGWALNPATNLDVFTSYSNFGTNAVTFAAPGGDAWTSVPLTPVTIRGVTRSARTFDLVFSAVYDPALNTTVGGWAAGTSMASPHAAGVAALIVGKNGGSMDPVAVEAKMRESADDLGKPGRDALFGHGRVNAFRAIQ